MFFSVIREFSKEHRYSQAVLYCHYVNHLVRDYLGDIYSENIKEVGDTIEDILISISNVFSIITGKTCRACLKQIDADQVITTPYRDNLSKKDFQQDDDRKRQHSLNDNTDFKNLWYFENGCGRYFFNNNLPEAWKTRRYENSSFKIVGEPVVKNFWFFSWVTNWNLSYKSTIVIYDRKTPLAPFLLKPLIESIFSLAGRVV